jgi:limonene-1,2-epoxide hydrolase
VTPVETVDAFIAAVERRDVESAVALMADDCVYDNVPMEAVTGPRAVADLLGPMITSCREVDWVVHRQVAQGDLVMNERLDRFSIGGRWVEVPVCGVWQVVDGKIRLWRDYFDLATFRSQMGA